MKGLIIGIRKQGRLLAGIAAGLVIGFGSAAVFAAIPDTNGVLHGCYRNASNVLDPKGGLRLIDTDAGETCASGETAITWNQTGPQGPAGPPGPEGPQGPPGSSDVGGQIFSNLLTTPVSTTDPLTPVLTVPEIGSFTRGRCYDNGPGLGRENIVKYTNTTGHVVNIALNVRTAVSPGQTIELNLQANHSQTPYTRFAENHYWISYDNGPNDQKTVDLKVGSQYNDDANGVAVSCGLWAQAVASK